MNEDLHYIEQIIAGKREAYAHLVSRYQDYVFTVIYRILRNREEAEEAAQDTFVKAFKMLGSYNKKAKFSTWLYRIAYNTGIDYSRKRKLATASIDDDERFFGLADQQNIGQFDQLRSDERQQYIEKALNQLPEQEAAIISLFYLKEQKVEELAEILNLSVSNVKVKLFRSRKKLKEVLIRLLNKEAKELL